MLELHFTALDLITDVMVLDVNVFDSTMIYWILRHLDIGLVVFTDDEIWSRLVRGRQDLP